MPYIVVGEPDGWKSDVYRKDFNYKYPNGLDLRPDSDFHKKLRSKIWERARMSRNEISKRFDSWREIDKTLTTYMPLKDKEETLKNKDSSKPVSIVFPYSYSMLEALLTYLSMAFFQDPMFQYEGVEDDDTVGAMLMELVIRLHCIKNKVPLAVHTVLRDSLGYGIGIGIPEWRRQYGRKVVKASVTTQSEFGEDTQNMNQFVSGLLFEGNALSNIDPYMWLPDPSVSSDNIQKGEFIGWVERDSYVNLLSEENQPDSGLFNVKYLRTKKNKRSTLALDQSDRNTRHGGATDMHRAISDTISPVDRIRMYITLIPREWKLSKSEAPEKWYFELAGDDVIIACERADHNHGQYPMAVASPEYDGYSITPIGRMEVLYGLQHTLDFLFNCYDDITEVLTSAGWVNLAKAKKANLDVATVDPSNGSMWFEVPKQWFEYDYDGILKLFDSKRYSLAVTPNHNMFGKYRHSDVTEFKEASKIFEKSEWDEFKIPMAVHFCGVQPQPIVIEQAKRKGSTGRLPRQGNVQIDAGLMAGFLGWFLSDGSITLGKSSGTHSITVKQSKKQHFDSIDYHFNNLPFHVNKYYDKNKEAWQWTITDKAFYKWLETNCYHGGTTGEYKEVPDVIRNADKITLSHFFECFVKGDGHVFDGHSNLYKIGTESRQLSNDLQEVAIKLGYSCHIHDSYTSSGKPFYYLNVNKDAPWATLTTRNTTDMQYKGKVYCFENSTHLTVVRRNGKVSICGQSHVANVRKAINDMLVVDPYLVNIEDLKDPQPGKLIRLRRPAWGRGVDKVVQQLQVNDITRGNIADSSYITQWMDRISGADQSMQGSLRQGGPERLTSAEFQGTRGSAVSRLQRLAMIIGMQFMQDIGTQFAVHTQQYMKQATYVSTVGRYAEQLVKNFGDARRARVNPSDLAINYDLIVRDGSIPGGNFSGSWIDLFKVIGTTPELMQQFDVTRIFTYIAQQLGAKNVEDFKRNMGRIETTTMPDDRVASQVQQGNLVPTGV